MSELAVGSLKGLAANDFVIDVATGSRVVQPGAILQVVQTVKDDGFTTASTTLTDVTGFAVTITPSSATSKVLLIATIGTLDVSEPSGLRIDFQRGTTSIGIGNTATRVSISLVSDQNRGRPGAWSFLDSPATTSATTYKGRMAVTGGTGHFNRDFGGGVRTIATLTAMEVAG